MTNDKIQGFSCPLPIQQYPHVLMAHGGGGQLMSQLISQIFFTAFDNPMLKIQHDGATFEVNGGRLAMTTDSYVVRPLFFPGGNIGSMAVHGTVNDLAMCGAKPLYLSAGFILEEGLPMETLWQIAVSMRRAADEAGVQIITGDTKVVDRGKGDGVFINTAGVGVIEHRQIIAPQSVQDGDVILMNGDLGRHGIAIMSAREGLEFETEIKSDSAPLSAVVQALIESEIEIHCLRDLTRGGLVSALNEIAETAPCGIAIEERAIPVLEEVQGACEILGLDPLYVANEGRFIAFVPPKDAERALAIMRQFSDSAVCIGSVNHDDMKLVTMTSKIGANRILDRLSGEQLPRIC